MYTLFINQKRSDMKTVVFVICMVFYSGLCGFAQNRIHGWEIDKITSIRVELTSPDEKTETSVFNSRQEIDTIISFLKNVDFRELNGSSINTEEEKINWKSKIVFQGQRDQVYLLKNSACIGKTSFLIDGNVIDDFRNLVKKLLTENQ